MIAFMFYMAMFGNDDEADKAKKKPKPKPSPTAAVSSADALFNALPEEKKQFVINNYQLSSDLFKKEEYEKAIYEIDRIHAILPGGYKDSLDLKRYAQKALDVQHAVEEEKRRKEQEENNRKELADLVAQAEAAVNAGNDKEARDLFAKVLEKDPENPTIARLRAEMEEKENAKKAAEEAEREKENKHKSLLAVLEEGRGLFRSKQYYSCIAKMTDAILLFGNEPEMGEEAKQLVAKSRKAIHDRTQPHLDAAKRAFDGGDLQAARAEYYLALKGDYRCAEARQGIAKITEIAHERSKKIYVDGLIAESISDYRTAKAKFKECLDSAVREDNYFGMCSRKYKRYDLLDRSSASAEPTSGGGDPVLPKLPSAVLPESGGEGGDPQEPLSPESTTGSEANSGVASGPQSGSAAPAPTPSAASAPPAPAAPATSAPPAADKPTDSNGGIEFK